MATTRYRRSGTKLKTSTFLIPDSREGQIACERNQNPKNLVQGDRFGRRERGDNSVVRENALFATDTISNGAMP